MHRPRAFKAKPTKSFCDKVTEFIFKTGEPDKHPTSTHSRRLKEYRIFRR
jgi:hypothetical protein